MNAIAVRKIGQKHPADDSVTSFGKWLALAWRRVTWWVGVLIVLHTLYPILRPGLAQFWPGFGNSARVVGALDVLLALGALMYRPMEWRFDDVRQDEMVSRATTKNLSRALGVRRDEQLVTRARQANVAVTQFLWYWRGIWLTWIVYYLITTIFTDPTTSPFMAGSSFSPADLVHIIKCGAFTANTVMFLLCFIVMWAVTVDERAHASLNPTPYWACAIIVFVIEIASILHGSASWVDYVNGVIGAVAMAMLVGRLESKYLSAPIWVIVALYGYAAIQPLWFLADSNIPTLSRATILWLALALKALLFLVVVWSMESRRLLFYMARVRSLQDHIEEDWSDFTEDLARS